MSIDAGFDDAAPEDAFVGVVRIRRPDRPTTDISVSTMDDAQLILRELDGEEATAELVAEEPWNVETSREHDPVPPDGTDEDAYGNWDD